MEEHDAVGRGKLDETNEALCGELRVKTQPACGRGPQTLDSAGDVRRARDEDNFLWLEVEGGHGGDKSRGGRGRLMEGSGE